ncbi:helix-turn-helix domain-containing protein [Acidianus sp. RZ1]|uniref:helix-turn-helix domain-containing protein n=1 Tax=Acidianus sp. RZ1 TaxID=1540082 RepID=UPI001492E1F8|nr:helix-turn-helix domain-containing protein [Acidianus sp. RZ1]NON61966.1 helix-turn-helix domain-containing protein [Acidianus sp. RZ1]
MKAIHNLGKEARHDIIEIMLENRSRKALADELGLTPTAVIKFSRGMTHPSDDTILKIMEIANGKERQKILKIMLNELVSSLIEIINEYPDIKDEKLDELRKILDELENREVMKSITSIM